MNRVISSHQIKSKFPILSVNAATFTLGNLSLAVKSAKFNSLSDVQQFVDSKAGSIIIFDAANTGQDKDEPANFDDTLILRYADVPDYPLPGAAV